VYIDHVLFIVMICKITEIACTLSLWSFDYRAVILEQRIAYFVP
jgi:hypothetical protein